MQELITKYRPLLDGEKIEALFMFQAGTVWASLDSVYQSCLSNDRFAVRLVLMTETTVETSHMLGAKQFLEEKHLEYEKYEDVDFDLYHPHLVFVQFPYDAAFHTPETLSIQFRRRGTRIVYVPYGIEISDTEIAIKDHFHSFVVENAWRIYTSSDGIKEEYDKYCHNRNAVRVTGSPKFDAINNKDILPLQQEIIERADGRKIIVWKMHFPKKIREQGKLYQITPYLEEYIEFAKRLDEYKKLFFVILAHPKMLKGVVASDIQGDDTLMQKVRKLLNIISSKTNTFIDGSDDYRNTFYHADAIIMDRSAVMIEASMLNIPVLLMKNQDYSEKMTISVDNVVNTFYQGTTVNDMVLFSERIICGCDEKRDARKQAVQDNFPYCDGNCGKRIVEDIIDSINEVVHKPKVVLYGTGEICRYYMKKRNWGNDSRFELIAVADSDSQKWGLEFEGVKVVAPSELKKIDFDAIVITTEPHYFEIKKSLVYEFYLDERKIWRIDDFVVEIENLD